MFKILEILLKKVVVKMDIRTGKALQVFMVSVR